MPSNSWSLIIEHIAWFSDLELSQEEMSKITGVSQDAYSKVLRRVHRSSSLPQGLRGHPLKMITPKEDHAFLHTMTQKKKKTPPPT